MLYFINDIKKYCGADSGLLDTTYMGDRQDRTCNLLIAGEMLQPLSYRDSDGE